MLDSCVIGLRLNNGDLSMYTVLWGSYLFDVIVISRGVGYFYLRVQLSLSFNTSGSLQV